MTNMEFTGIEKKLMQGYLENGSREPRENLIKLVGNVDEAEGANGENSWPYIILDRLLTDEMVDFLLLVKLREPVYIEEYARRAGKSIEETAVLVDQLAHIGILEYVPDENGVDRVELPVFIVGSFEHIVADTWRFNEYTEEASAFRNYSLGKSIRRGWMLPPSNSGVHRVVPVETAIANDTKHASWEEVSSLVEETGGPYAVLECVCRKVRDKYEESSGEPEFSWCLPLGRYAEYTIRTGKGKEITKEEYMDILRRAEEKGYVHNISNEDGPSPVKYICNCDYRTCLTMRAAFYTSNSGVTRGNFVAEVDADKCGACGQCQEVCPANAAKLGRKLPEKEPVEIVPTPLPNDDYLAWGPEYHQPDYLLERLNVQPETGSSPCKTNCPAHVSVQGYLKLAAQGKYMDALELIKRDNPFPAICGSVCNHRCESVCTRGDLDEPVAIDEVKKFIARLELDADQRFVPKKINAKGHKIAVIGSGPAGLTCAYYLAVMGHEVTVFEKENKLGGMMRYGIPSFHLEKDVIDAEIDVLRRLGVHFRTRVEIGKDTTIEKLRKQGFKGFYVAIGAQSGRKLGIPGEDAEGVMSGIEFMRECAEKGSNEISGRVVVIGGGNVAIDVSRTVVRSGADEVRVFSLEGRAEMPASPDQVEEAEHEGVIVGNSWGPKEILQKDGRVSGIVFKRCVSVLDEEGRFSPQYDENDTITVEADYILTSIGQSVTAGSLLEGSSVEPNGNMTIKADGFTYQTSEPDIFTGGDVHTGPQFTVDAIAAGKQGAESLHRFVWGHDLRLGRDRRDYKYIDKDNMDLGGYDTAKRQRPASDSAKRLSFRDDRLPLTEEQVKAETARCLSCGVSVIDQNKCLGCAICTTRCKFDAITLNRKFDVTPVRIEELPPRVMQEMQRRKAMAAERETATV